MAGQKLNRGQMVGGRKLGMTTGFGLILCIAICLCVARAEEDLYTKAKRALDAENHVHGKVRTLHAPAGEGIRPRTKTRRDEDDGFIERSDKSGAHSVKLRHSADGGSALARTRAKEEKWKTIAKDYKKQIEEDKHHAAYAADQLQDALNDMWDKPDAAGTGTHCDKTGCWTIDTSDATTRATLQAFRDAAKGSKPLAAVASAAQSEVAATAADVAAIDGISAKMHARQRAMQQNRPRWTTASGSGGHVMKRDVTVNDGRDIDTSKPLAKNLRKRCENPWQHAKTQEGACSYAKGNCRQRSGLFNYQALPYCTFGSYPLLGLVLLLFWLFTLAIWLGMAADEFLCPCLSVMAKVCKMSETVAGVTFLALGNGAPDIFSQVASAVATPHGAEMALGEVLGSSLIVVGVVLGIVMSAVPFTLVAPEFVRDVLFFLGALLWLFCILLDSVINVWESAGFIALYSLYIYAVVSGWAVTKKNRAEANPIAKAEEEAEKKLQLHTVTDTEKTHPGEGRAGGGGRKRLQDEKWVTDLVDAMNPFEKTARDGSAWEKLVAGVKAPGLLLMRLSSPVVDDTEVNAGWCKPAVLVQLTLCPLILSWCFLLHGFDSLSPAATHLTYACSLLLGGAAACLVHVTSDLHTPPPYQTSIAFLGFITSVAWIYALAAELVHLLQAMGTLLGISDTLLGLTVLAFANSVGDLVANLAMARAGMPTMAAAACIGAPLVNLLMGVGGATLLGNVLVQSPYPFLMNLQLYVSLIFLVFALVAILVYIYRNGVPVEVGPGLGSTTSCEIWSYARSTGAVVLTQRMLVPGGVLILIYCAFLVTCLGLEAWGGRELLTENVGKEVRNMGS